jgi:hypothetical protein
MVELNTDQLSISGMKMFKIALKTVLNGDQRFYLSEHGYYTYTNYIRFTEYKTKKKIAVPWNNLAYIIENYEETK